MFSYFGSKKSKAKLYPPPRHRTIIEPFAGAAGYSVLWYHHQVRLFDIDTRIVAIWKYLIGATSKQIAKLPIIYPGDTLYDLNLSADAELFLGFMIGASPNYPHHQATIKSNWNENKREEIARFVEKIKHWTCERRHFAILQNEKATWFVDPPYEQQGIYYRFGCNQIHYPWLAKWCMKRKGQIIVCENGGATWLPFKPLYQINGQKNNRQTESIFHIHENH